MDLKVSLDRINKFLMAEDIQADYIKKNEDLDVAINMKNGNFYWLTEEEKKLKTKKEEDDEKKKNSEEEKKEVVEEKPVSESCGEGESEGEKLILQNIKLDIKKGSFVAILGE